MKMKFSPKPISIESRILISVALAALFPCVVYGNCTEDQFKLMQTKFTQCTKEATTTYQSMLEKGADKEEATCVLFETFINTCGETWTQCHTEEDIKKMKDMQLEALLGQYVDSGLVQLDDCPIVNQHWEAEENYDGSGGGCSDKAYVKTQTKFQECSHTVSTEVYQSFQGEEDKSAVTRAICDAIYNISISCPQLLKSCFGPMDVKQMVKVHLKEIKSYLINLSGLQITSDQLDNCTIPEFAGEVKDYEYYYEEYPEEDELESGEETETEISEEIKKLLKDHKSEQPSDQPAPAPAPVSVPANNNNPAPNTRKPAKIVESNNAPSSSSRVIHDCTLQLFVIMSSFFFRL
eukprot:TRINITY_DN9583_c0_g1_i2.p1 TRINITY_DN9583_c0_g1~~TRINITY_DN9583_c0_g1_i2.p1  ORF type:complete len:350 (-),score=90.48 TRINITY_DN9583_c0_g1_i2:862-1911(-)